MRHPLCLKIKYVNLSWGQDLGLPPPCSNFPTLLSVPGLWLVPEQTLERWREREEEKETGRKLSRRECPQIAPGVGT